MTELQPVWGNTIQTTTLLGVSRRRLDNLRHRGVMVQGHHYRIDGRGDRSPVRYHLERVEQLLVEQSGRTSDPELAAQEARGDN